MNTLVLAHYYTTPEVQALADHVGDSLELSIRAKESKAERIVFAGVKFMAETAKIINPNAQVILPDANSTCSLVTQSAQKHDHGNAMLTLEELLLYVKADGATIVSYINSSYQVKALSDVIVTSANVEDIISDLIERKNMVYFTPDRNMGAYLNFQHPEWGHMFGYYEDAVCEVHDKFAYTETKNILNKWHDHGSVLMAHPESPLPILKLAHYVGSTSKMLNIVKDYKYKSIIYVATEEGLLHNMREARPDLDIRLAPVYSGCQCNACPYMKLNTVEAVQSAIEGKSGLEIDYIPEDVRKRAKLPIEIMLKWRQK